MLDLAEQKLTPIERAHLSFIRRSLDSRRLDRTLRWCQRRIGATWILHSTRNLLQVHGIERIGELDPSKSYVLVSNHRSFFDLYVVTAHLVGRGLPHRIFFPVRANFFYDHPFGFVVNGVMSFFAMYPPVFRDRLRQTANLASLDEVVRLLRRGGTFVGLHPEGTRNKGDDPYALLPPQSGVGRIIHGAKVSVIPVFVNGLSNSIPRQVITNATGRGTPIHVVFGRPIDFGGLLEARPTPKAYRAIAERTMEVIGQLGAEERAHRAQEGILESAKERVAAA